MTMIVPDTSSARHQAGGDATEIFEAVHGDPTAALESVEQHVMGTLEEAEAEAEAAEAAAVPAETQSGGPGGGPPAVHEVKCTRPFSDSSRDVLSNFWANLNMLGSWANPVDGRNFPPPTPARRRAWGSASCCRRRSRR